MIVVEGFVIANACYITHKYTTTCALNLLLTGYIRLAFDLTSSLRLLGFRFEPKGEKWKCIFASLVHICLSPGCLSRTMGFFLNKSSSSSLYYTSYLLAIFLSRSVQPFQRLYGKTGKEADKNIRLILYTHIHVAKKNYNIKNRHSELTYYKNMYRLDLFAFDKEYKDRIRIYIELLIMRLFAQY